MLNFLGISVLIAVAAGVARGTLGMGFFRFSMLLIAPAMAAGLEGMHAARTLRLAPDRQVMWHATSQMAVIYVQVFFLFIIAIVMTANSHTVSNLMTVHGMIAAALFWGLLWGATKAVEWIGYRVAVQHTVKRLSA